VYIRHKYVKVYTTSEESNEEEIVDSILKASDDENNQTDDGTEEIVYKAPSIPEVCFSIDQVRTTLISLNSDVNTPAICMALKNIANHVKEIVLFRL